MESLLEIKKIAFSGHRNLNCDKEKLKEILTSVLIKQIESGADTFFSGMAMGFDLIASDVVLSLKKRYKNIKLVAVVPCSSQSEKYDEVSKSNYNYVMNNCDEIILTGEKYTPYCMLKRNRYLVDNSEKLICYLNKQKGGTKYTKNYAEKKNRIILNLCNEFNI